MSSKDIDGDILALGDSDSSWSPRLKFHVIVDIRLALHTYYMASDTRRTDVRIAEGPAGKYLRADCDGTGRNCLRDLPDI